MPATLLQSNPFISDLHRELRMLRYFVQATEVGLKAARDADHAEVAERIVGDGDDAIHLVVAYGGFHAEVHHQEIPRALRYAQVTSIFFTVESRLVRLCDHVYAQKGNLPKKFSDLKGNSPFKACRKFFSHVVDAKVTVWEELELARLVRNCIGHANGFPSGLSHGEKALRVSIEKCANLELDTNDRLKVRSAYVSHLLDVVTTLFTEICSNLKLGEECALDYLGIPDSFGFVVDADRKKWAVLGPDDADLPGNSSSAPDEDLWED